MTSQYTVEYDLSPDLFRGLVQWLGAEAMEVGLVTAHSLHHMQLHAYLFGLAAKRYLVREQDVQAWPGTQMVFTRRTARLHVYRSCPKMIELLVRTGPRLRDWSNPRLPQDLHFVRADGHPIFGSIATEYDAWLSLEAPELDELRSTLPGIHDVLRAEA